MKSVKEKKPEKLKKRVAKAHSKAEFVGILYLIATIFLAAMAFLPLIYGTSVGRMSVVNFWKPFIELKNVKGSYMPVCVNAFVAAIYAVMLLTVVINVLRSFSRLSRLFKKKASKLNGFNRNAIAMDEMGKIFSGTYCSIIVFTFMIHLIAGASFTNLFFIAVAVGLIFHFWAGLVGGNVSLFTVGENVEEEKRTLGRIAPFFRNAAQLVFVGLIMYFISKTNLMLNALKWLEKGAFSDLFKGAKMDLVYYGVIPLAQFLMCIWTIVLLKHATASTEFHRDGMEAPGMKNFRVFSVLLLLTAGGIFGLMCFAATKRDNIVPSIGTLCIAIIAVAALIEEFCMCRLPNVKGKVTEEVKQEKVVGEEEVEIDLNRPVAAKAKATNAETFGNEEAAATTPAAVSSTAPAVAPAMYHIPLQCISQPGVFMQPNGQPVMMMPMVAGPQIMPPMAPPAPEEQENIQSPVYAYMNPYANPYANPYTNPYTYGQGRYWANGRPYRPFNPYQYVQETATEAAEPVSVAESKTEEPVPEEKPAPVVTETVKKPGLKERKANLAADKKSLRAEAAMAKKESKAAAERAAVEKALAEKWMKKAKQPIAEEAGIAATAENPVAMETPVSTPVSAPVSAPVEALAPAEEPKPIAETAPVAMTAPAYVPALPKEAVMETYAYQNPVQPVRNPIYPEATDLTEEDLAKPLPPKKWTVNCPDCAMKLTVKDGAFAYRCPECGGVFQLRKVFRTKQKTENAENQQ